MKTQIGILLFLSMIQVQAKMVCQIEIDKPGPGMEQNGKLNGSLKKHQKLDKVELEIGSLNFKIQPQTKTKIKFKTVLSKKFEAIFTLIDEKKMVWKINFSESQVFPQLLRTYLNVSEHNSKYYLMMYDVNLDKTVKNESIITLTFDKNQCTESHSVKL